MNNMTTNNNNRIPELRFPGFTGEWVVKKLGDVACLKNGYAFKSDTYVEKGKYKIVTIANVKNGEFDIHSCNTIDNLPNNVATHQNLKIGDIVISMTGNVGRVCLINQQNCLLNQRVGLLEVFDNSIYKGFLYQTINSLQFEKAMILSAQGAAQPNIGKLDIESYIIAVPTLAEQQKIAECLSSLDEEIAAEAQKADALKNHKKGLMQQLFPQPGQTTPQRRFPGFTGEWEEKKLGEVGTTVNGLTYSPSNVADNGLLVLRSSNIQNGSLCFDDCVYVQAIKKYNPVQENDILICVRNGSAPLIGKSALIPQGLSAAFGAFMMVFRTKEWSFVFQLLKTDRYRELIEQNLGARINSINSEDFKIYSFLFPPTLAEQQKIADCLSELDEMISAQQQKVEALKEHKKGLMQKLFPKM